MRHVLDSHQIVLSAASRLLKNALVPSADRVFVRFRHPLPAPESRLTVLNLPYTGFSFRSRTKL